MIKIYFDRMHSCTLTITNGEFFYDFEYELNEDGRNIVEDTCKRMENIFRLVYAFNELKTNQLEVRLDTSSWCPTLYVSGVDIYLCALMTMLSNVQGVIASMNYHLGIGSEIKVSTTK